MKVSSSSLTGTLIPTEQLNPRTVNIDCVSTQEMLTLINQEDQQVALAVQQAIPQIALVVDRIVEAFKNAGRLFYFGAGTSGRLGVLDASECPPTYGTAPQQVQAFIAGGDIALRNAVEGAEDSKDAGLADVEKVGVSHQDVVIGLSASGGAPYVLGVIEAAKAKGAYTAAITCHPAALLAQAVDQPIVVEVGPEVVAGSTRMKAGTAQKLVLNMLTTGAMIQSGKTYQNLMVDVQPTNQKLKLRAQRIVQTLSGAENTLVQKTLEQTAYQVKPAVLMLKQNISFEAAKAKLERVGGKLRLALGLTE